MGTYSLVGNLIYLAFFAGITLINGLIIFFYRKSAIKKGVDGNFGHGKYNKNNDRLLLFIFIMVASSCLLFMLFEPLISLSCWVVIIVLMYFLFCYLLKRKYVKAEFSKPERWKKKQEFDKVESEKEVEFLKDGKAQLLKILFFSFGLFWIQSAVCSFCNIEIGYNYKPPFDYITIFLIVLSFCLFVSAILGAIIKLIVNKVKKSSLKKREKSTFPVFLYWLIMATLTIILEIFIGIKFY